MIAAPTQCRLTAPPQPLARYSSSRTLSSRALRYPRFPDGANPRFGGTTRGCLSRAVRSVRCSSGAPLTCEYIAGFLSSHAPSIQPCRQLPDPPWSTLISLTLVYLIIVAMIPNCVIAISYSVALFVYLLPFSRQLPKSRYVELNCYNCGLRRCDTVRSAT
jgi:hypothetical protein